MKDNKKRKLIVKAILPVTFAVLFIASVSISAVAALGPTTTPNLLGFGPIARVPGTLAVSPSITKEKSYNWAGYAADNGGTFTKAVGSWTQNKITCNANLGGPQYAAFWVGIDGFSSSTVEQTGTLGYCAQGSTKPHYYAWYEYYPAQAIVTISGFTVHAGDKFLATIVGKSDTSFVVTLKDVTTGQSSSNANPTGFVGTRTSIECITEEPSTSSGFTYLANFGSGMPWGKDKTGVSGGGCSGVQGGKSVAIGGFGSSSYELASCNYSSCSTIMAQPSSISSDGTSFTMTWKSAGP